MSSGASVTRPSSSASTASMRRSVSWRSLATDVVVAPEARAQPGQAVAHRERAEVGRREHDLGGLALLVVVLHEPVEHVLAVAGQRQLQQRAGEARPRLDQRDQRAGRDVEPLQRALEVVADLVDQPVDAGVLGDHPLEGQRVLDGAPRADHPGAQLQLVGAQPQDEVVELAGHGQRPEVGAELVDALHGVGHVALRPEDRDVDQALGPVEDVASTWRYLMPSSVSSRCSGGSAIPAASVGRADRAAAAVARSRTFSSQSRFGITSSTSRHSTACLPRTPSGTRGEHVGAVLAHPPLVDHAGEAAGAGQHAEQRHLGQRNGRGVVVDEQDLVAGERQLVAAARGGAVDRGDPGLAGVRGRVLDPVAGLVGELAEVHLPRVRGLGEHPDVGARAEVAVLRAGDDDRAHTGVFEAQPLGGVVELDVDAQVVAVHLQLVARHDAAVLGDVQPQVGDLPVDVELPVPVPGRVRVERHLRHP